MLHLQKRNTIYDTNNIDFVLKKQIRGFVKKLNKQKYVIVYELKTAWIAQKVFVSDKSSNIFSMIRSQTVRFEHLSNLHLLDLKAQKKSTNYKQFLSLPLTFQESLACSIRTASPTTTPQSATKHNLFKINKLKVPLKKLQQLSRPKRHKESGSKSFSNIQLQTIIVKCDRLKTNLLTNRKLKRFQHDAGKCYNYLSALSTFNFQKYEEN